MRVVRARMRDVEEFVEMNRALFREDAGRRDPFMNLDWPEEEGREYFGALVSDEGSICLLAEIEGEVAGYLVGRFEAESSLRPVAVAKLESMYVWEERRNCGVGSALVEAFLRWAQVRKIPHASVTAYAENDGAINFYEKFGFHPTRVSLEMSLRK